MGINYGFLGALVACFIVAIVIFLLKSAITYLASLYHSDYYLQGIDFATVCYVLVFASILGLVSAWMAVNRQLATITQTYKL